MSRYMMLITLSEAYRSHAIPQGLLDEMGEFVNENLKSGVLIDTAGLGPTSESTRIRLARGKTTITDGPFTEAKEVVGGYALFNARSRKDAIDFISKFVDLHRRNWPELELMCELRPVEGEDAPAVSAATSADASA